ncbi:Retinol dehydrogenase 14-like protein, partial [Dinothrombium tinctorium]
FAKTAEEGAQTTIFLSVSKKVENVSGKYFVDCREARSSRKAEDVELAKKLWSVSESLTAIKSNKMNFENIDTDSEDINNNIFSSVYEGRSPLQSECSQSDNDSDETSKMQTDDRISVNEESEELFYEDRMRRDNIEIIVDVYLLLESMRLMFHCLLW